MALRKHSPTLHRLSSFGRRSSLFDRRSRFARRPARLSPAALREAEQERALEEEVEKIKKVLWEIYQTLNRSSDRIDLYIESIDRNLARLAEQKEELALLERKLGIEQPSV